MHPSNFFSHSWFCIMALAVLLAQATPASATLSLVWSDEFNGTSLDIGKWGYDLGNGCPDLCGWGNNELEWYRPENVAVTGGNLVITARAESYGGSSFTSGKITTRGKHSFLYGRIEMRAKLPTGGGMWPAFWMMPQDAVYGGWAASGEIDIMESSNETTRVGGALHFGGTWPDNTSTSGSYSLGGTSFADDFHIYAIEWEPDEIRWYVDGVNFMTRTSSEWYTDAAPGDPDAPFDQEFYILLNLAVGGWYTGCTDPGCITADLPQDYLVDYVRVYQDIPNAAPTVAVTAPANGATLPSGDITITADAADTDGTIATVEFYADANLLGEDTTAPYSFVWPAVPDGCYTIRARAIDDLGGTAEDAVDVTVGAGCGQGPYHGTPFALPTKIEAEDFDVGGEGVAYFDVDAGNDGGQYRTDEDVDIENCSDTGGGYNVGWIRVGEWIEYTVDVPFDGLYTIEARVSSLYANRHFKLEFGGQDVTGDVVVPQTGNWQTWATVSVQAVLSAGTQVMRFVPGMDDFNLNWFDFTLEKISAAEDTPAAGRALHACYPNPFNPSTTIAYDLARPATVSLAVYDLAGALVRTLDRGDRTAGPHRVTWDGRDETGRVMPAGIYLYRLATDDFVATRRMTLLK